jgi:hypothetical protein
LAFTSLIYSWVQSSFSPQHSHWTDSISISFSFSLLEIFSAWRGFGMINRTCFDFQLKWWPGAKVWYIIIGALIWLQW